MKKFDIPEIPNGRIAETKLKFEKIWNMEDLNLENPIVHFDFTDEEYENNPIVKAATAQRMVEDPEFDLEYQLAQIRHKVKQIEAGSDGPIPALNLIHFGTGPVATAFGSKMVMRDFTQPHFEPAFHTAEEALRTELPDLYKGGWLGKILERIEYYNEATQGKIPITSSDNAGPWNVASSIWHYEDMLEAIITNPEAVHHLLRLTTEAIIKVNTIQKQTARNAWRIIGDTVGGGWLPRGTGIGDDVSVTVSPAMWKEFFLPYNTYLSKRYGGLTYHCCMRHDWHLKGMSETPGFMGFDADPDYNSIDKIEEAMTGKGVWSRHLGMDKIELIKRFKGKFGFFLTVWGKTKEEALENSKKFLDEIYK